jgi:Glycosyl transferase family 11
MAILENKKSLVAMSTLGKYGRFGNQIFQYAFLKIYAKKYNLGVEIPSDWIGHYLFEVTDKDISIPLQKLDKLNEQLFQEYLLDDYNRLEPLNNIDIQGFFQYNTQYYKPYKDYFRSLFKPASNVEVKVISALNHLKSNYNTLVGLHLRRGDYGYEHFFVAPNSWYLGWLESVWLKLDKPGLFIATDEPDKIINDFDKYSPIISKDLKINLPEAEFYSDFYLLSQCDMVAISNSSFSFTACMLNEHGKIFLRPSLMEKSLIEFDPWNSNPLLFEQKVEEIKDPKLQLLQTKTRLDWSEKNVQKLQSELGQYKIELEQTQSQLQQTQSQLQQTQSQLQQTEQRMADIKRSKFWKMRQTWWNFKKVLRLPISE